MEELLEDYKKTLQIIIEKYSNYEEMTLSDFFNKYEELKKFSVQGFSGMFSEEQLMKAYNNGMKAGRQISDNFDI